MDFVICFGMANSDDRGAQKTRGVEALFTAVVTRVLHGKSRPIKHLRCIRKIETMLFEIDKPLIWKPSEVHRPNYTYKNTYYNIDEHRRTYQQRDSSTACGHAMRP